LVDVLNTLSYFVGKANEYCIDLFAGNDECTILRAPNDMPRERVLGYWELCRWEEYPVW